MGLFGGSSKKSSTTNTTETNNAVTTLDNSGNEGINDITTIGNVKGSGNVITLQKTDYGAIDAASAIADRSLQSVDRTVDSSIAAVKAGQSVLADIANAAQETARRAAESDTTETIKYLVITLGVVGSLWALSKTRLFR